MAKVVRAERFELVDSQGNTRALLAAQDGASGLFLSDENGRLRVGLALDERGPMLELYDDQERPRACLSLRQDGSPWMGLFDETGGQRVIVEIGILGNAALVMRDSGGTVRASLYLMPVVGPEGEGPGLALTDGEGRIRLSLNLLLPDGCPGVTLFDKEGHPRLSISLKPDDVPDIVAFGSDRALLWKAGQDTGQHEAPE